MDEAKREAFEALRKAPRVCKYRIHAPEPGSYVEGFGLLKSGTEVDLPKELAPHRMWWPLNDAAWKAFEEEGRVPYTEREIARLHDRIDEKTVGDSEEEKAKKAAEAAEKKKEAAEHLQRLRKDFEAAEAGKPPPEPKAAPDDRMTISELATGKKKARASDGQG